MKNLLEKKEIDETQHGFIKNLLEKRDEEDDSTNDWWKNIFDKKFSGKKPYWAKLEEKAEAAVEEATDAVESKEDLINATSLII